MDGRKRGKERKKEGKEGRGSQPTDKQRVLDDERKCVIIHMYVYLSICHAYDVDDGDPLAEVSIIEALPINQCFIHYTTTERGMGG